MPQTNYKNSFLKQEKLSIICESYDVIEKPGVEPGKKKVTLKGTALIFGRPTRNKVLYTVESARATLSTWIGRPFLNSHDDSNVLNSIGHVEHMDIGRDEHGRDVMFYEVDVDPEERDFIRKAKRKDIPFVSVQVLVDDVRQKESVDFGQYIEADIKEGLELSSVLIPGDWETNGIVSEQSFAEKFFGKKFSEQITDVIKKDNEEEKPLKRRPNPGMAPLPVGVTQEDITTDVGAGLIQTPTLAKTIKKATEPNKITPDTIPGSTITRTHEDIDKMLAVKTNEPDEKPEEQQIDYTYGGKKIPYNRKGGNNIPAPLPKGYKTEGHSIWKHCGRPMLVAKNSSGSIALHCNSCSRSIIQDKRFWKETLNKLNRKYEIVKTIKILKRR